MGVHRLLLSPLTLMARADPLHLRLDGYMTPDIAKQWGTSAAVFIANGNVPRWLLQCLHGDVSHGGRGVLRHPPSSMYSCSTRMRAEVWGFFLSSS